LSIYVLKAVWDHTRSTGTAWEVMVALGDGGSKEEGITWITQETIAEFGRLDRPRSIRAVRDAIGWLEEHDEIEIRQAQRGRRRINVYRVILGAYGEIDLTDRDLDLPFQLSEPFSRPADIAARRVVCLAERMGTDLASEGESRPAESAARNGASRPADFDTDDRHSTPRRPADFDRPYKEEPEVEPKTDPAAASLAAARVEFPDLSEGLVRLRVAPRVRLVALGDPERAQAWLEIARREANHNPAGLFVAGFQSGDWPAGRGSNTLQIVKLERHRSARERSLRNLVAEGGADEARYFIDVEWENLTTVERSELHELVDELISDTLPDQASTAAIASEAGVA